MARLEDRLAALRSAAAALREDRTDAAALKVVRSALQSKTGAAAASAAAIAGDLRLDPLSDAVADALDRFLGLPAKSDPMCRAKRALVEAMRVLPKAADVRALRRALVHVQLEPIWGGQTDTAPGLRGSAAIALVEQHVPEILLDLVGLLADPESEARTLAVRAVGALGSAGAEAVLRHKALVGDAESEVTGDVLRMLLALWPGRSHDFVIGFLEAAHAGVREAAALALAESRAEGLVGPLLAYAERRPEPGEFRVALLALGMLRDAAATDALLEILGSALTRDAVVAVEALAIQAHQPRLRQRVERLVEARGDRGLRSAFDDAFGAA